jgi:hypothetical protein
LPSGRLEALGAQFSRTGASGFGEVTRDSCERIFECLGLRRGTRMLSMSLDAAGVRFHLRARTAPIQRRVLVAGATYASVQFDELVFIEPGE